MTTEYDKFLLPEDEETTLPSGLPVTLRFPPSEFFLRAGMLPGGRLASAISQGTDIETLKKEQEVLQKLDEEEKKTGKQPIDMEKIRSSVEYAMLLATYVIVKPVFSMDPKAGEIHVRRLRTMDRTFVVQWYVKQLESTARGGSADMETFRAEPATSGVADAGGDLVQQAAG